VKTNEYDVATQLVVAVDRKTQFFQKLMDIGKAPPEE
jgi:hypothetical protein